MKPYCCFIPCENDAEFEMIFGGAHDAYTHACADHVGHMMEDGKDAVVRALGGGEVTPSE